MPAPPQHQLREAPPTRPAPAPEPAPLPGTPALLRMAAGRSREGTAGPPRASYFAPGLPVSRPGDSFEREADRAAEEVTRDAGPGPRGEAGRSGGPLDPGTREWMEARFGWDFSGVRVHADGRAAESARGVDALAYTVGRDVVFGEGRYDPASVEGRRLLAHELAHVVQQGGAEEGGRPGALAAPLALRTGMMVQRQPPPGGSSSAKAPPAPPPTPAPPTPAQVFTQAVATVQPLDAKLHGLVSQVALDGPSVKVRTVKYATADTPPVNVTAVFNLKVQTATLPSGTLALFPDPAVSLVKTAPDERTFTADMVIQLSPPTGAAAADELAKSLYHEGVHMLLFMDEWLPGAEQSPHAASHRKYAKVAKGHASYGKLWAELEVYIELDVKTRAAKPNSPVKAVDAADYAKKGALETMEHLVEEKYAYDREAAAFKKGPLNNRSFALTYLLEGFKNMVITVPPQKDLARMCDLARDFLDEIDAQVNPPAKPVAPPPTTTKP